MVRGLAYYLKRTWKKSDNSRMISWRKDPVVKKLEKPSRLDRARSLGYKARKGFIIVRVRILRGGHKRPRPRKGRRSKNLTIRKVLKMNYKWIAEARVQRKFKNLEVLNSYNLGKDGKHYFYRISSMDKEGLESKYEQTTTQGATLSKPNAPAVVEATLINGKVELSWKKNDSRIKSYIVVRKSKQGWFDTVRDEIKGIYATKYIDTKITPNTTYFYTIYGVDKNGIKSEPSTEIKIEPSDKL